MDYLREIDGIRTKASGDLYFLVEDKSIRAR